MAWRSGGARPEHQVAEDITFFCACAPRFALAAPRSHRSTCRWPVAQPVWVGTCAMRGGGASQLPGTDRPTSNCLEALWRLELYSCVGSALLSLARAIPFRRLLPPHPPEHSSCAALLVRSAHTLLWRLRQVLAERLKRDSAHVPLPCPTTAWYCAILHPGLSRLACHANPNRAWERVVFWLPSACMIDPCMYARFVYLSALAEGACGMSQCVPNRYMPPRASHRRSPSGVWVLLSRAPNARPARVACQRGMV